MIQSRVEKEPGVTIGMLGYSNARETRKGAGSLDPGRVWGQVAQTNTQEKGGTGW